MGNSDSLPLASNRAETVSAVGSLCSSLLISLILAIAGCGENSNSGAAATAGRTAPSTASVVPAGGSATEPPPAPGKVTPFAMGRPDVVLMVTGRTGGTLELCNCRGPMPGGLSRRSGMVISYRDAFEHCLLLDAGDLFWIDPQDLRNDYLLKGYSLLKYDAVVMGDQEWAAPAQRLRQLLASEPLAYLSTGVESAEGGGPVLPEVKRQWGSVKVAVLSQLGQQTLQFLGQERTKSLKVFADAFKTRAARLKREGYVVIALVHGDADTVEQVAKSGLADLVIRGHSSHGDAALSDAEGNTWKAGAAGAPVAKVGGCDVAGVLALKVSGGKVAALEYRLEPLTEKWPLDKRLMQTYQAYAHAAMRAALDAKRTAGLEYVPAERCGTCHQAQYDKWKSSRHSRAYQTLADAGRQGDPNCLMCHTSGFGTSKGFYTAAATPRLSNVNCQDCHRFNEDEHHQAGFKAPKPNEELCTSCHTLVTDPDFKFSIKQPKVACPKR